MSNRQRIRTKSKARPRPVFPALLVAAGGLLILAAAFWLVRNLGESGATATPAPGSPAQRISLGDARAAFETGDAVFLDVRDPSSYAQSHIPGAISIPLGELEGRLNELDKEAWIITYCT